MAKKSRVWDGTAWQELASAQTDLTAYSTTAQTFVRQTSSTSSGEASTVNINTKPWNMPWGIVQYATPLSTVFNTTSATPVDVTGMSISFTGIANRRYRVNFNSSTIYGTTGERARLTFTGTNVTPIKSYYFKLESSTTGTAGSYSHIFTATGSSIVKLQFCRDVGSNTATIYADTAEGYGHFYLEDIGPV